MCSLPVILTNNIKSTSDFHLVFEEIGLMASSTDFKLATIKVNLTLLKNTVDAFKNTVILQQKFIEKIPPPIYKKQELIIPIQLSNNNYWITQNLALMMPKLWFTKFNKSRKSYLE
jgi:hypothetical protein